MLREKRGPGDSLFRGLLALIQKCEECEARWLPDDPERWRAYLCCDEHVDEPAEVVVLCPTCAEHEFGEA